MKVEAPVEGLRILTPNELSFRLKVRRGRLAEIISRIGEYYDPFTAQAKPAPFARTCPPPKGRHIDNPLEELKRVQRKICDLLGPVVFPAHICGGIPKRSLFDNLNRHLGRRVLVTLDIRGFFPSVREEQVFGVWRSFLGCSESVSKMLTSLTTYRGYLPQGAPSSPLVANLLIWSIDKPLREVADDLGVSYSTWVDDLAFSGDRAREMIDPAFALLTSHGFHVSRKKLRIMGMNQQKILNGSVLGSVAPRATKQKISRLRAAIHNLACGRVPGPDREKYIQSILGKLGHVGYINSRQVAPLRRKLALSVPQTTRHAS
jgi:RNA-directed DNA polymerase